METNKPHPTGLQWDLSKITKGTGLGERSIDDSHCYRQPHSVSPWPLRVHSHATPSTINSTQGQYSECSSPISPCPSPTALQAYCRRRPLNVCWRNDLVNAVWSLKCAFCASSFYERCIIPWPFRFPFNQASRLKPDSFSWPWIAYSSFLWYHPAAWMQALRQVYPLTGPTSLKPCGLKRPSCVVPPSSAGWPGSSATGLTWTHSLGCSQAILPSSVVEPSSFHGGNSGPRGQRQNRKTSGVQALRPNSTSLLPHSSFKGNPVTNTIIFSGEELGGAGSRLYLMIGGWQDWKGLPNILARASKQTKKKKYTFHLTHVWIYVEEQRSSPTRTLKEWGVSDIGKSFFSTWGIFKAT